MRYLKRAISSITSIDEYDEEEEDEYIEAAEEDVTEEADDGVVEEDEDVVEDEEVDDADEEVTTRRPTPPTPGGSQGVTTPASAADQDAACDDGPRRRCGARRMQGFLPASRTAF